VPGDGIYKGTASHACGARKIYQNTVAWIISISF
jgi:hypothetical protein